MLELPFPMFLVGLVIGVSLLAGVGTLARSFWPSLLRFLANALIGVAVVAVAGLAVGLIYFLWGQFVPRPW
jgi:hypothetical protein